MTKSILVGLVALGLVACTEEGQPVKEEAAVEVATEAAAEAEEVPAEGLSASVQP